MVMLGIVNVAAGVLVPLCIVLLVTTTYYKFCSSAITSDILNHNTLKFDIVNTGTLFSKPVFSPSIEGTCEDISNSVGNISDNLFQLEDSHFSIVYETVQSSKNEIPSSLIESSSTIPNTAILNNSGATPRSSRRRIRSVRVKKLNQNSVHPNNENGFK